MVAATDARHDCFSDDFCFWKGHSFVDVIAVGAISWIAYKIFAISRRDSMTEVHDFGSYLTVKLDAQEISVNLSDIEKVALCDGKDGLNWIVISLSHDGKFGKFIQFYPSMYRIPVGTQEAWIKDFNERISAARIGRAG